MFEIRKAGGNQKQQLLISLRMETYWLHLLDHFTVCFCTESRKIFLRYFNKIILLNPSSYENLLTLQNFDVDITIKTSFTYLLDDDS